MKYLIDLDGTILNGRNANVDSVQFMKELQTRRIEYRIMTNSIKAPAEIVTRLKEAGIDIPVDAILNPINVVNNYLIINKIYSAYIVGSSSERNQVCIGHSTQGPQVIILLDFEKDNVSYCELQHIYEFIQRGVPVISASGSPYYLKNGIKYLDTGAFVQMFSRASNSDIKILGKPSEDYFKAGIASLRENADDITVVGDDYSTDIQGAKTTLCKTVLLRSGKYKPGDEDKCEPDKVVNALMEIFD